MYWVEAVFHVFARYFRINTDIKEALKKVVEKVNLSCDKKEYIIEKPKDSPSNYAIIGLYFYDNNVINYAKTIKPSRRGELEITDLNNIYLNQKSLDIKLLPRGTAWFDVGTHDSFLTASNFISNIENNTGLMVANIEEIAYKNNWITKKKLLELSNPLSKTNYGEYLKKLIKE